jgi:hypothetical protein
MLAHGRAEARHKVDALVEKGEDQQRRPADSRLLDRRDDAAARVTSGSPGDLHCRSGEHFVDA